MRAVIAFTTAFDAHASLQHDLRRRQISTTRLIAQRENATIVIDPRVGYCRINGTSGVSVPVRDNLIIVPPCI